MTPSHRPPVVRLFRDKAVIDGFAGGGGASTGIQMALGRSPNVAINHDPIALALHAANHPDTKHITSNIRHVRYETVLEDGQHVGLAWFSPDCTHHSKARGGKPFRDRRRARRIRGLGWEAVRCAKALAPDVIVLENVEEWRDWCPLLPDGTPDWSRKGENYRRWKRELAKAGLLKAGRPYVIEDRELVACDYGDPTKRKRLFVIARCDGQPIVWPEPTHGPGRAKPYRTAAECIDFTLPVPSIFMTPKEAKAWGQAHGVAAPKRPLATATKRRIARGIQRFVLEAAEPFIVNNLTNNVPRPVTEPLATTLTGNHKYLVQPILSPFLAGVGGRKGQSPETSVDKPYHTITAKADTVLVTPFLAKFHGDHGKQDETRGQQLDEPIRTLDTSNRFALIAPYIVRIAHGERDRNGKRRGKGEHDIAAPLPTPVLVNNSETRDDRAYRTDEPARTLTAAGCRTLQLVAAFLAKHNAGHEATGQRLKAPIDTVTTRDSKALVTSHLLKLRGGLEDHPQTSQDLRTPAPTITAGGTHYAEVRAFLVKYYGTKKDGRPVDVPLDTITTKERYGLVTVTIAGEEYAIVDIGMRMLTPRELFLCQGFPPDYEIDRVELPTPIGLPAPTQLTKKAQTRLVGNSVPPHLAAAIIAANVPAATEAIA